MFYCIGNILYSSIPFLAVDRYLRSVVEKHFVCLQLTLEWFNPWVCQWSFFLFLTSASCMGEIILQIIKCGHTFDMSNICLVLTCQCSSNQVWKQTSHRQPIEKFEQFVNCSADKLVAFLYSNCYSWANCIIPIWLGNFSWLLITWYLRKVCRTLDYKQSQTRLYELLW